MKVVHMNDEMIQYCTFYLDKSFFGVEAHKVQEVARIQNLTTIPLMPDYVKGLINLRGEVVMSIDMSKKLHACAEEKNDYVNLVLRDQNANSISLMVDHVGDVIELSSHGIEDVPENIDPSTRKVVKGMYKLSQKFMLVLDVDRIMNQIME